MNSITTRITGLVFLLLALTVFGLIYLMELQMEQLFQKYLSHMGGRMGGMMGMMMGVPEQTFLLSVHHALIWVGLGILLLGLLASYVLARSITIPLRNLSYAVEDIEHGVFNRKVKIESDDEIGHLAAAFNRMTEGLEANNRLRQRLLADIAHELKTPLAVIQGHLEGMLEGVVELNKEQISSLFDETSQLSRLIRDLRDLSLAEAGQLSLDKSPTDLNQVIQRALQMLRPLADEKHIVWRTKLSTIPHVLVDPLRINQILYNLLTNALRHTPVRGRIIIATKVAAKQGSKWVQIDIKDSGAGISAEDLPYIFHHFYRADQSRDRKSGGSGIGLAIVKQLVEIHGGLVEVESKVNAGSKFMVYLPLA